MIALEGIDGSGTTTQASLLQERIRSEHQQQVHFTAEPSVGTLGQALRHALSGSLALRPAAMALLFAADRLDHVDREVEPRLARGEHVVSDRYIYSSLAYQSLNNDVEWVAALNQQAPEADLTIYVRVDPATASQRRNARGEPEELFDRRETQQEVAAAYDRLLGDCPTQATWRLSAKGKWRRSGRPRAQFGRESDVAVVDGSRAPNELHEDIYALAQLLFCTQ